MKTAKKITADSIPVLDGWGPDLSQIGIGEPVWTPSDWIEWYYGMKEKYGKEAAVKSFADWFDTSTFGAAQLHYPFDSKDFGDLVISEGIKDRSTILTQEFKAQAWGDAIQSAILTPFKNLSAALNNTTGAVKWIVPLSIAALAIIVLVSVHGKLKTA